MLLLIHSIDEEARINKRLFMLSLKYLKQLHPINPCLERNPNWEEMRHIFGTIFNLYGFQRFI